MKKLHNDTLQKFLNSFIEELKRENEDREYYKKEKELNIPFIISTLYQSFNSNEEGYSEFISDLEKWNDYSIYLNKSSYDYNGIIDMYVQLSKCNKYLEDLDYEYIYSDYDYQFSFLYDERNWGYCQCTPDIPDYREDKQCCGHGCDASFCSFELHKIVHIMKDTWHGDEHDYWEFEDEFYMGEKELADKKAEENRVREIKQLQKEIENAKKRLAELKLES